jgi:hypothetical protein
MNTLMLLLTLIIPSSIQTQEPIGKVTIVEDEIEIEYVDTTVWSQWVFDTDSGIEYMTFNNDGTITYSKQPEPQG